MNFEFLDLSSQDGVFVIRLDRPKMNALSIELLAELYKALEVVEAEDPASLVIWGGERLFAAGADIEQLSSGHDVASRVTSAFHLALDRLADMSTISIAAITGYALGGGLELALACDLRVMAKSAKLGLPEILLGVIPGGGGTQRLTRLVGTARAKDLVLSGRHVLADEALAIGLVNRVVDDGELFESAMDWARKLVAGPKVAQGLAKAAIDGGCDRNLQEGLILEQQLFSKVFESEDSKIGIGSFLANGPGKAEFVGR